MDAARDVMIDIQAAAPFPGMALGIQTAAISCTVGPASSSGVVSQGAVDLIVNSTNSPRQQQDLNSNGEVATSQPNENASSSTPPSQDPPGTEIRN